MSFTSTEQVKSWMKILDQIDQSILQSLDRVTETPPFTGPKSPSNTTPLIGLEERLSHRLHSMDQAAAGANELDEELATQISRIVQWQQEARSIRERIALMLKST